MIVILMPGDGNKSAMAPRDAGLREVPTSPPRTARGMSSISWALLGGIVALISWSIRLKESDFGFSSLLNKCALGLFIVFSYDYLVKPSPLLADPSAVVHKEDTVRPFSDKLVWTSLIYGCAAAYSASVGQHAMATLQLITCCGSGMYHLRKEAMYFNFDNIFASSLLFTTFFAMYSAWVVGDRLSLWLMAGAFPLAAFLIVYCGMPASAVLCSVAPGGRKCCMRKCTGQKYDFWHTMWHLVSGLGTAYISHFYSKHWPGLQCGHGGWEGLWPELPLVPTLSLGMAVLVNCLGNWAGVMPVS